jgi:hypothetical protein
MALNLLFCLLIESDSGRLTSSATKSHGAGPQARNEESGIIKAVLHNHPLLERAVQLLECCPVIRKSESSVTFNTQQISSAGSPNECTIARPF